MTETNEQTSRYRGSVPYGDDDIDRLLFRGRSAEATALLNEILAVRLVVLYAKSGVGKTSLLNAGVFDGLRKRDYLPIPLRVDRDSDELIDSIFDQIEAACDHDEIELVDGDRSSLLEFFRTAEFWSEGDEIRTPVLIFDQFEELFTLHREADRAPFLEAFTEIAVNHAKRGLRPPALKIVISMREDFVAELEMLAERIPEIRRNRYRLLPLGRKQAKEAIVEPAALVHDSITTPALDYEPAAVEELLNFLCESAETTRGVGAPGVEPVQLQILCRHYAAAAGATHLVTHASIGERKDIEEVLRGFYEVEIRKIGSRLERRRARELCEETLISATGRRLSLEEGEIERVAKVSREVLRHLVDARVLRSEPRLGSQYYELSHDTLIEPIRESLRVRRRWHRKLWALAAAAIVALAVAVGSQSGPSAQEQQAFVREQQQQQERRQQELEGNQVKLDKFVEAIAGISHSCLGELSDWKGSQVEFCAFSLRERRSKVIGIREDLPILIEPDEVQEKLKDRLVANLTEVEENQFKAVGLMVKDFADIKKADNEHELLVREVITKWKRFLIKYPSDDKEQQHAIERLDKLSKLEQTNVLTTCESITPPGGKECAKVRDEFTLVDGKILVWAWALISVPHDAPNAAKPRYDWYKVVDDRLELIPGKHTEEERKKYDEKRDGISAGKSAFRFKSNRTMRSPGLYQVQLKSRWGDRIRDWNFEVVASSKL